MAPFLFTTTFTADGKDYTAQSTSSEFNPTSVVASYTDVGGVRHHLGGASDWVLDIGGVQDWVTATGLSAFLVANEGAELDVSLTVPGGTWSATVVAVATKIGGAGKVLADFSVSLPSSKPVFTAAT